ncbi:hypothetical protein HYALB_00007849 [Hymenoscyphus albidus]|uniref:Alpha/beta hydrolase fold-3 domain-containing protein n=1 Tax=Hymenoscyphus albidus TaxID=595503 RepID=A0A9N9LHT1_9HELO|nr:hypothetical protein HYALB_00007849 [Hymenoscyphus albidus]
MILGQVSWLDCFVFLIFLAPQLILRVGFFPTLFCGLRALPFLLIKLPRLFLSRENRSPFVQTASWFEDFIIRCVRYAFANIPANIGRVFFSKPVALPFLKFRMLRHGFLRSPIHWEEVNKSDFKGIWMIDDESRDPDIVIYYAHGGGFSMGSSYFYLEFLLTWLSLLKTCGGFDNPAIFSLEYTLVPDDSYPSQLREASAGYKYTLSKTTGDPSKICVAGDSAGGTIILTLLLHLASISNRPTPKPIASNPSTHLTSRPQLPTNNPSNPGMALLISPWTTLSSPHHKTTRSDYLDPATLQAYATLYAGPDISIDDPVISPGRCKSVSWWQKAWPKHGIFVVYGAEEVFAPEIRGLVRFWEEGGLEVGWEEEKGGIHAWPVASVFLGGTRERRLKGLRIIVGDIRRRMGRGK